MKRPARPLVKFLLVGAVAMTAGACSGSAAPGWTFPSTAAASVAAGSPTTEPALATSVPPTVPLYLTLTILSDTMTGKVGWPVFLHSDFTLPANSTLIVTITNFDNATRLPKGSEQLAAAAGIVGGTFIVTPIDSWDPNGSAGPTTTASALDPRQVSHTFTVPQLGINVPIAPNARTTFTIHTGNPCNCAWHCLVPCGTAPAGYGGPMAATSGYMEGTLTVV